MPIVKNKPKEKKASEPRHERLEARITSTQKKMLRRAASLEGKSVTDFVVQASQQEAHRTIQKHETMELGDRDREIFISALLEDREPTEKAKEAANRYLKTLE